MTAEVDTGGPRGAVQPTRRFWVWSAVIYAAINLPFLFLTLDAYNLNGGIYSSSYLWLGLNPYQAASSVGQGYLILPGAGYFVLPYNMLAFLGYPAFGFNAIAASAVLKAIGVVAGFLAARIAFEIARREGKPNPKTFFYAILFNPFLIFVNAIAGDPDLLVVFLVFLAVFLFRYGWKPKVNVPAVVLGAVAISLTVLTYYFTLLFVPTLILWLDGRRHKLLSVVLLGVVLAIFALPIVVLGLGSINTSSLLSTVQITGYSFPYYLSPPWTSYFSTNQRVFTVLAALLSIVIPVVFRRWNIGQGTTLLTVLTVAFALTFRLPADVFAILAALVPLSFALSVSGRPASYWRILLFEAFLVPVYLLVEMFNGPGQVTGVYYWFYPYLHQNVILYDTLGQSSVARFLFLAYSVGTVLTIAGLVWLERRGPNVRSPSSAPAPSRVLPPARTSRNAFLSACLVAALLVAVPVGIAYATPAGAPLASHQQFNSQEFYAYDVANPLLYPLAGPTTYSVDSSSGTVNIVSSSPPVGFARNIAQTTNRVNLSVTVDPKTSRGPVTVWQTNRSEALYSSMLALGAGATEWTPLTTQGGSPTSEIIPPIDGTTPVYAVDGTRALEYNESAGNLSDREEFFAAEYSNTSSVKNTLWTAFVDPQHAAECYLNDGYLYLATESGGNWTITRVITSAVEGQWFLSGFEFNSTLNRVSAFVNDQQVSLPLNLSQAWAYSIYLGKYNLSSAFDRQEAWIGNLTGVSSSPPSQVAYVGGFFASTENRSQPTFVGLGNSTPIVYYSSASGGSVEVSSTNLSFVGPDSLLLFGKLAASTVSLEFSVHETYFVRTTGGVNFAWIVVGFAVLLPAWIFIWCSRELWKSAHPAPRS